MDTSQTATTSPSRAMKAGYGVAETGISAAEIMVRLYALKYYTESIGLAPSLAGWALGLAAIWDGVSDPLMGAISDRTTGRWGRRRGYILIGSLMLAAALALLFLPPALGTQAGRFAWLLGATLALNTALTVIGVPHIALGGELTFDRDERTEVYGWRLLFNNVGLLVGFGVLGLLLAGIKDGDPVAAQALWPAVLIIGAVVVLSACITVWATRRHQAPARGRRMRLRQLPSALWGLVRSPVLAPLFAAYLIANVGLTVNSAVALYYYEHRLGFRQDDVNIVMLAFILTICPAIVFWVWLSRRYGKRIPALIGLGGLGVMTCIAYPLLRPGELLPVVLVGILGGVLVGAVVLLDSILADTVDYDELRCGTNREGLLFGLWRLGSKLGRAGGLVLCGFALEAIGFRAGATTVTPETARGLAWIFGPGVGLCFLAGCAVFLLFPLTDARHERVQRLLSRRRAGRADAPAS